MKKNKDDKKEVDFLEDWKKINKDKDDKDEKKIDFLEDWKKVNKK